MSVRLANACKMLGVSTVGGLRESITSGHLEKYRQVGIKTYAEACTLTGMDCNPVKLKKRHEVCMNCGGAISYFTEHWDKSFGRGWKCKKSESKKPSRVHTPFEICELELLVRSHNTLVKLGLTKVDDVRKAFEDNSILKMPGIGRLSYNDIDQALKGIPFGERRYK